MPPLKKLTISCRPVRAGKKRKCYHDPQRHHIEKGDLLLEVKDGMGWNGYCLECAIAMLTKGISELSGLLNNINVDSS